MRWKELQEARLLQKKHWTVDDFVPGDRITMTYHSLRATEKRAAIVGSVGINKTINGKGMVTFSGDSREGMLPSGQGSFEPTRIGRSKYGLVDVEITYPSPRRSRPKRHVQEASIYGVNPFFKMFFANLFDPNAQANYAIPQGLSLEEVIDVFTKEFGKKPRIRQGFYEWEVDFPQSECERWREVKRFKEECPHSMYIDVSSSFHRILTGALS